MSGSSLTDEERSRLVARAARDAIDLTPRDLDRLDQLGFWAALRAIDDASRLVRAGRGEDLDLEFSAAFSRLEATGGDVRVATAQLLWSEEHRPGMQEALRHAEEHGVTLAPRTLLQRLRRDGRPATLSYVEALALVMDYAARRGIRCSQARATRWLSRVDNDVGAVLADVDAMSRRQWRRRNSPCRAPFPSRAGAGRHNALADCGCDRCLDRLTRSMAPYIGKILASSFFKDLDREEAHGEAHEELMESVDRWTGGPNFAGWFGQRLETRVRGIYRARKEVERTMLSLDAPAFDAAEGRSVTIGELVPEPYRNPVYVVIDRERLREFFASRRLDRAERAEEYDRWVRGAGVPV